VASHTVTRRKDAAGHVVGGCHVSYWANTAQQAALLAYAAEHGLYGTDGQPSVHKAAKRLLEAALAR